MRLSEERRIIRKVKIFDDFFNQLINLLGYHISENIITKNEISLPLKVRFIARNESGAIGRYTYNLSHYIVIDNVKYACGLVNGKYQYYDSGDESLHVILSDDLIGSIQPEVPTTEEEFTFEEI